MILVVVEERRVFVSLDEIIRFLLFRPFFELSHDSHVEGR